MNWFLCSSSNSGDCLKYEFFLLFFFSFLKRSLTQRQQKSIVMLEEKMKESFSGDQLVDDFESRVQSIRTLVKNQFAQSAEGFGILGSFFFFLFSCQVFAEKLTTNRLKIDGSGLVFRQRVGRVGTSHGEAI
jgi:hypothetical protein